MAKITFVNNPRPFKTLLNERIEQYFISNNIKQSGNWKLYSKTIILLVSLFSIYSVILFAPIPLWGSLILWGVMGFIQATIGFNVMHDAAHGSYSENDKLNNFIAFLGGDLMGGSTFMWKIKHNILHHTYTNIDELDDDIAKYPMFRLHPQQKRLWFHHYQHLYSLFLYFFTTINWILFDDYWKVASKKIHNTEIRPMKPKEHLEFWLGKIFNLGLFLVIPIFVLGFWKAIAGFLIMHGVLGITLALVFQMAHAVEEAEFPIPNDMNKIENEWALHQVKTTVNFSMKSKVISWLVGGLNFQVEHHLFPKISHIHYPEISKIVQETCEDLNIKYNYFQTFGQALASHFIYLKKMGTA
ncbi:MAG: acyl-CoA desaturase [Chitinophagaceae bacterium]|nr:MAG: Linoleoyl-CoA desaturase [Bacteroidetes bacterium OLB11]MCC6447623.1 acyl-CoA desaturase [Chitinophagaceae bacterium]HMN31821.1 acyl-CoA desaturase [Chitinophagaceae bacterium]